MAVKRLRVIAGMLLICSLGQVLALESTTKRDKNITIMITPIMFKDFDVPQPDVEAFYDHYRDLIDGARELVIIYAVGQAEQMLAYQGKDSWDKTYPWAIGMTGRTDTLSLRQIKLHADTLRAEGRKRGTNVKIFEFLETGPEFCGCPWKYTHLVKSAE